jgi:hypothetical protein
MGRGKKRVCKTDSRERERGNVDCKVKKNEVVVIIIILNMGIHDEILVVKCSSVNAHPM